MHPLAMHLRCSIVSSVLDQQNAAVNGNLPGLAVRRNDRKRRFGEIR